MWNLLFVLCSVTSLVRVSNGSHQSSTRGPSSGACVLPAYPEHGGYSVTDVSTSAPGQRLNSAILNFGCSPGFEVQGRSSVFCVNGMWSDEIPRCVRADDSIGAVDETKTDGSGFESQNMDCGIAAAPGVQLGSGVRSATPGSLPWHAIIYRKRADSFICSGSLVTRTAVISAAHCFWENGVKPASDYEVAVGKIYRFWNDTRDVNAQKSAVSDIKVPARFQLENNEDDIAVVILTTPVQYNAFVKPVCVDFNLALDRKHLQNGSVGKVPSWGLTEGTYDASEVLRVVDIPYVNVGHCITQFPLGYRKFITSDKFCAGSANGTAVCKGDSAGGLVFPEDHLGTVRYYLRGVISHAPVGETWCSPSYIVLTQITKFQQFITSNVFQGSQSL